MIFNQDVAEKIDHPFLGKGCETRETDAAQAPPETMIFQAVAAEETGSAIAGAAEKLLSNHWWGCLDWLVGCWVGWVGEIDALVEIQVGFDVASSQVWAKS